MIGVSVSDIIKALREVKEWAALTKLPGEVAALRERVAALEAKVAGPAAPPKDACPKCRQGTLHLTTEEPDPIFGDLGVMQQHLKCDSCGFERMQQFKPGG